MKIAVMGAGAVGCYYGGMLARAGHDVVLIGRPQHVEAVERQGLRLETQTFDERIHVSATTEGSAVQGAQLVLFCVKSNDTESAAAAIKPHLAPDAVVLSLQNGVENADRLRALLPQEVIAAAVYIGVGMAGPGHVRHYGLGELVIEQSKASDDVARALISSRANITVFQDHLADEDAVAERLAPFDVVCIMRERTPMPASLLARLRKLKLRASTGQRNASIDLAAAPEHGISVVHTSYTSAPTIELTWALILASAGHIAPKPRRYEMVDGSAPSATI